MNRAEFAANEITQQTERGGLSVGYATMMSEANSLSKPDQAALTQDLVKNGVLPKLSLAYLDDDMKQNGLTSIDKQGITALKTSADKSGNPLQAAMADSLTTNFDSDAQTRRLPLGRFGEMKTGIFKDTLDEKVQAHTGAGTPADASSAHTTEAQLPSPWKRFMTSSPATSTDSPQNTTETVKNDGSYWSLSEQALGLNSHDHLDRQQDREIFGLMQTLQKENGNAMLQAGDSVTIQASDVQAARRLAT